MKLKDIKRSIKWDKYKIWYILLIGFGLLYRWNFCSSFIFPKEFELVVSRCQDALIGDMTSDSEYMIVYIDKNGPEIYLVNNITNQWIFLQEGDKNYKRVADSRHHFGHHFVSDKYLLQTNNNFLQFDLSSEIIPTLFEMDSLDEIEFEVLLDIRSKQIVDWNEIENNWASKLATADEIYVNEQIGVIIGMPSNDDEKVLPIYIIFVRYNHLKSLYVILGEAGLNFTSTKDLYPDLRNTFIGNLTTRVSLEEDEFEIELPNASIRPKGYTPDGKGLLVEFGHDCIPISIGCGIFFDFRNPIQGGIGIWHLPEEYWLTQEP